MDTEITTLKARPTNAESQTLMDRIAWEAFQYIIDRRRKIDAKKARGVQTGKCKDHNWGTHPTGQAYQSGPPCWARRDEEEGEYLPDDQLCEHCVIARQKHNEYLTHSRSAGLRLRSLERLVNKAKGGRV
jgi:hypothetical protein